MRDARRPSWAGSALRVHCALPGSIHDVSTVSLLLALYQSLRSVSWLDRPQACMFLLHMRARGHLSGCITVCVHAIGNLVQLAVKLDGLLFAVRVCGSTNSRLIRPWINNVVVELHASWVCFGGLHPLSCFGFYISHMLMTVMRCGVMSVVRSTF